ncbi:MAG: CRTAC1 family protein [Chloroflexota bacterium]
MTIDGENMVFQHKHNHRRLAVKRWSIQLLIAMGLWLILSACSIDQAATFVKTTVHPSPVQFVDVASDVGLDFQHGAFRWGLSGDPVAMMGGGLCWLDFDQDGWLDLYVVNSYAVAEAGQWENAGGLPQSALFQNQNGQFKDVSETSGTNLALRGNGCVAADLNLDGWPDLYITSSRYNALLWNNGDGTFTEGAEVAQADAYGWQSAAAVGDVNGDSWPDIFLTGYVDLNNRIPDAVKGFPNTHLGRRDLLFLNNGPDANGQVTFQERGIDAGLEATDYEYGLGASLLDFDNDGDLDLYVANDTNPNRLYENVPMTGNDSTGAQNLGFRLVEQGDAAQADDENSGMGVTTGDYDSDGRPDLFITNLGQQLHSIYLNQSQAASLAFQNSAEQIGLPDIGVGWTGWGTNWADFDLDTDLDLLVINGDIPILDMEADAQLIQYFDNRTAQGFNGQFVEVTEMSGLDEVGPRLGRGSAVADYDNDGDLDVAVSVIGQPLMLLQNNQAQGNWLQVNLTNFGVGAIVTATLPDGRTLYRQMQAGSSYLSSEDTRCHFGLGTAETVSLHVQWPNGQETYLAEVQTNQQITVQP